MTVLKVTVPRVTKALKEFISDYRPKLGRIGHRIIPFEARGYPVPVSLAVIYVEKPPDRFPGNASGGSDAPSNHYDIQHPAGCEISNDICLNRWYLAAPRELKTTILHLRWPPAALGPSN